jgi:hypothetical protein
MRKKRFTVEQMIGVLKQAQVGVPVAEVIRKAGISEQRSTVGRRSTPAWRWTKFVRWRSCKRKICG